MSDIFTFNAYKHLPATCVPKSLKLVGLGTQPNQYCLGFGQVLKPIGTSFFTILSMLFVYRSNTRVLCFTRTSPLIHNLPSMYPSTVHSVTEQADHEKNLSSQVYNHVPELVVCKLESVRSERSVKEMLKEFKWSEKQVILLLANMQEVSKSAINHLRVMIEEECKRVPTLGWMPFPTPPVSFNCSFSSSEVYVKLKCLYWFPFIECEAKAGGFYIVRRNTATCIQLQLLFVYKLDHKVVASSLASG